MTADERDARAPADAAFTRGNPHRFGKDQGIIQGMKRETP